MPTVFNTLVHADYLDRASIRIQKWPSGFEFRNPGVLRVPAELALQGGESDCRNRTLQQMFCTSFPRSAWERIPSAKSVLALNLQQQSFKVKNHRGIIHG